MRTTFGSYPLTPLQQGLIYQSLIEPDAGLYIQQLEIRLHEPINASMLKLAWDRLIGWNDIFRTHFNLVDTAVFSQEVVEKVELEWNEKDWSEFSCVEQQHKWQLYLNDDRCRGFDFSKAPPVRFLLVDLGDNQYQFLWTYHHALLDGRSHSIALSEVFRCYQALIKGMDYHFPDSVSFSTFARWLSALDHSAAKNFWLSNLHGFEEPMQLSEMTPIVKPCDWKDERGSVEVCLDEQESAVMRAFAAEYDLMPGTLIQGAWAMLLNRYSGREDIVYGVTRACRHASIPGSESILGLLINTVPLRIAVRGDMSVLAWLQALRADWVSMRPYEHTPLAKIQNWSGVTAGNPLFHTLLVYEDSSLQDQLLALAEDWKNREIILHERGDYPLVALGYGGRSIKLRITYNRSDFQAETVQRMLVHWKILLGGLNTGVAKTIADLPMLTGAEMLQQRQWNPADTPCAQHKTIVDLFEAQVRNHPDSIAVSFAHEQLSYLELDTKAEQLAFQLAAFSVGADTLVGVYLERSLEMVIGLVGILKAGCAYVPIGLADPEERVGFILKDAGVSIVVTTSNFRGFLSDYCTQCICLDDETQTYPPLEWCKYRPLIDQNDLAYVIYTSGTTGVPKGVSIEHRSLVNLVQSAVNSVFTAADMKVVAAIAPITFDASINQLFVPLSCGGKVVLADSLFSLPACPDYDAITYLGSVPALIETFLTKYELPVALRILVIAASIANKSLIELLRRNASFHFRLFNLYGPTEATVNCTVAELTPLLSHGYGDSSSHLRCIGKPFPNTRAFVLNAQQQLLPVGIPGELVVAGACLAREYLNRNNITKEKFVEIELFGCRQRVYKTGDQVYWLATGNLQYLGRKDHQVKIHGFRIEPGEIEMVLDGHEAVQQVVVAVQEDSLDDKNLVAYLVCRDGQSLNRDGLHQYLKQRLPVYMLPSAYVFLDALPLMATGKVDYSALPVPGFGKQLLQQGFVKPRTPLEKTLVDIWTELLNLERIGVTDDFSTLGGNSLRAIGFVLEIEKQLGYIVPLAVLFNNPTIRELATTLQATSQVYDYPKTMVAVRSGGFKQPFFCVHGRQEALTRYLDSEQPFYWLGYLTEGDRILDISVEEIAAIQISNIQEIQPHGPYRLGGFSFGGTIAFEMAQQLHRRGEEVVLLALFDTVKSQIHPDKRQYRREQLARRLFDISVQKGVVRKTLLAGIKVRNWILWRAKGFPDRIRKHYRVLYTRYLIYRSKLLPTDLREEHNLGMLYQIGGNYQFKAYPERIILFVPERGEDTAERIDFVKNQWQDVTSGGIDVYPVKGAMGHLDILEEPYVQGLAKQLNACLENLDEG